MNESDEIQKPRQADACTIVIFGAAGDLTKRKLLPALYHLFDSGLLSAGTVVLGFARTAFDDQSYRQKVREDFAALGLQFKPEALENLLERVYYYKGDLDDDASHDGLAIRLGELEQKHATGGNRLFYLATLPDYFAPISRRLGDKGLVREEGAQWARVIVEKPFGHSFESARALNKDLHRKRSGLESRS